MNRNGDPMIRIDGVARLAAVAFASMLLVASCGSSSPGADRTPGTGDAKAEPCPLDALPAEGDPVKIDLWYANLQGKTKQIMEQMVADYNASQDRVVVEVADQHQGYDEITRKYTQAMKNGTVPSIVFTATEMAQFLTDSGTLIPGEVCADEGVVPMDDLLPVVKRYFTIDGVYVPGAVNLALTLDYWNKVPFATAGVGDKPPATLDELRADAAKIAAAKIPDMQWPISTVASPRIFNAFVTAAGAELLDNANGHDGRATRATFDTPEVIDTLTELQSLYADGLAAKVSNTPGQLNHYLNVAQGKSALVIETSAAATTIEDFLGGGMSASQAAEQNLEGLTGGDTKAVMGFGPLPVGGADAPVAFSGGAYYVTNGGSAAQRGAAMDFIRYVNQVPQQVTWLTEGSFLSANTKVADDPAVKKFFSERLAGVALELATTELAGAPVDHTGPLVGPSQEYDRIIQSMMESVLFEGSDVSAAVKRAQDDVTAAIRSYNDDNGF